MKTILYSVCIGSLALALTAGGAQAATDKDPREQSRSSEQRKFRRHVPRTRAEPWPRIVMFRQHNTRQRSNAKPRTSSAVNRRSAAGVGDASYSSRTKPREERKDA